MRPESSAVYRLADRLLDGGLEAYVQERRLAGESWRRICLALRDDHGIDVSHETLRGWFPEDRRASAGAA